MTSLLSKLTSLNYQTYSLALSWSCWVHCNSQNRRGIPNLEIFQHMVPKTGFLFYPQNMKKCKLNKTKQKNTQPANQKLKRTQSPIMNSTNVSCVERQESSNAPDHSLVWVSVECLIQNQLGCHWSACPSGLPCTHTLTLCRLFSLLVFLRDASYHL